MKKISLLWILVAVLAITLYPKDQNSDGTEVKEGSEVRKYKFNQANLFKKEALVISYTDMNCSYFISKKLPKDLYITGCDEMDLDRRVYSDRDRVFINKGSSAGLHEVDKFWVVGIGKRVTDRINHKKLGYFHLIKAVAELTYLYEDKGVATLKKTCNPVELGDILVPIPNQEPILQKRLAYEKWRLPKSPVTGRVVYSGLYTDVARDNPGPDHFVTLDLNKEKLSRGDWVLFYKIFGPQYPPVIFGTGIVVYPNDTNSTVKVIDTEYPVEVGSYALLLQKSILTPTKTPGKKDDKLPIIETLKKEATTAEEGKDVLEIGIIFDIDQAALKDTHIAEMQKINDFIASKPGYVVVLRGYCCSIGGAEYNLKLSEKRVDTIKKYLADTFKIKEEAFEIYFYGEKDAPYDNTAEEQRRKNRLDEIQVIER